MIKIAQIGAGYWGANLIRNFTQFSRVSKYLVCDLEQERLDKFKRLYPTIDTTRSAAEVFADPAVEAVVIATPAASHYELASQALKAGKHVFVEKPLATSAHDAEKLVSQATAADKILMVGHTFLYNAAVRRIKEYIDQGELGEIYYILSQRLNLGRVRQDVNALWNLAPHDISIILYWLGESPSKVMARGLTFLQEKVEDVVFMDLNFPSGRAGHIHVSWLHPQKSRQMIVVGSKKMLVYDDVSMDEKIAIFDKGIDRQNIIRQLPEVENFGQFQLMQRVGDKHIPKVDFVEPLKVEGEHFIDCILNNQKPITDGLHGLEVVRALEQAQNALGRNGNR